MHRKPNEYRSKKDILRLFKENNLIYLERTRIAWKELLSIRLDKSPYYQENKAIFEELLEQYCACIKNNHMAPIYIKYIDADIGYGVFAAEDIGRDEFIGEYAGVVQIYDEDEDPGDAENGYATDYSWYYLDELENGPVLEINGKREGNEMRFVNHSTTPNVDVEHMLYDGQWIIFFKASRLIKKNEQLLISYGEEYWNDGFRDICDI